MQDQNGYEAWRVLVRDMQPPTRQRGLALIQSLNKIKFEHARSVTKQLLQFELMVREYGKTSGNANPDDLKVAGVVSAILQHYACTFRCTSPRRPPTKM